MPDIFRWNQDAPLPPSPAGFVEREGYRFPLASEFRRDDLIEVAYANGFRLTPDLLKKWRQWRFLRGPTAGGPTGKGSGKGQTWSAGAAFRVAWISRWKARELPYDVIRLALWPWTTALERERPAQLLDSLRRFLEWDERYHEPLLDSTDGTLRDAYESVVAVGTSDQDERESLLIDAGVQPGTEPFDEDLVFLEELNFDALRETLAPLEESDLVDFITAFRNSNSSPELAAIVRTAFKDSPLGLARVLVRELHRFKMQEGQGR